MRITISGLDDGTVGQDYVETIATSGGTGSLNFSVSAGNLPAGLALNAGNGAITGIPTGPVNTSGFTVTVSDSGTPQQSASQVLSIDIVDPLRITTATLPDAPFGVTYSQPVVVAGGTLPYVFSIVGLVQLPEGLSMTSDGTIVGVATPTAVTQTFVVQVSDGSQPQQVTTRSLQIAIPIEILTTSLADAQGFEPYVQFLSARGGSPPYFWGLSSGSLPNGNMNVVSSGAVVGTPNGVCSPVTSTFTVFVQNNFDANVFAVRSLDLTVNPVALDIVTTVLPAGLVGFPYSTTVRTRGGALAFDFSTTGALPAGLGPIQPFTGQIGGTPTTPESPAFDVNVTDGCGASDTQPLSIAILPVGIGRNNSIATATPIGNGLYDASISPAGDPNTVFSPDQDFYEITTTAAGVVDLRTRAQVIGSPLDAVMEVVDVNGVRLNVCTAPNFNSPCMNDDEVPGSLLDSFLAVRLSGATTFYVRVLDWRGDARPDLTYQMWVEGVP